jgi:hypothetical protein
MKFYEDPVYIDMCMKAGEIQAQKDHGWHRWPKENVGVVHINMKDQKSYAITIDGDFVICRNMETIWLPRLDQLIEMLDIPLQKLLTDIYHWDCGGLGAGWPTGMDHSWEVMFLGYLMMQKHGKSWDLEKREWVKG